MFKKSRSRNSKASSPDPSHASDGIPGADSGRWESEELDAADGQENDKTAGAPSAVVARGGSTDASTIEYAGSTPLMINREPRETFVSDLSEVRSEGEEEEEGPRREERRAEPFPGPVAWAAGEEGKVREEVMALVRSYAMPTEDEEEESTATEKEVDKMATLVRKSAWPAMRAVTSFNMGRPKEAAKAKPQKEQEYLKKMLPSSGSFSPELYLATVHKNTTMRQLRQGMNLLEAELSKGTGQLKKLVKENFERFISCKNTIDDVYVRLHKSETENRGANTKALSFALTEVQDDVHQAFAPMMDRSQQLEQIKSVMGVLKRFHSSFVLPSRIRHLAQAEDYQQLVTEYKRAKAVLSGSDITTWTKLFAEVEKCTSEVCKTMLDSLNDPYLEMEALEDLVIYILQLQCEGLPLAQGVEPAGIWLLAVEHHVHGLMKNITQGHEVKLEESSGRDRSARAQGSGELFLSRAFSTVKLWDEAPMGTDSAASKLWAQYIRELCAILLEFAPHLWRFRNSSKLKQVPDIMEELQIILDGNVRSTEQLLENLMCAFKTHALHAVKALLPMGALLSTHTFTVLRELGTSVARMEEMEGPPLGTSTLQSLGCEAHEMCYKHLSTHLQDQISLIVDWEDWKIMLGCVKWGYTITGVPDKLGLVVRQAMEQFKALREEHAQFESNSAASQKLIETAFFNCFESFVTSVKHLASVVSEGPGTAPDSIAEPDQQRQDRPGPAHLLALMGNCRYVRTRLISELVACYGDILDCDERQYAEDVRVKSVTASIQRLEKQLLQQYTHTKKCEVNGAVDKWLQHGADRFLGMQPLAAVSYGAMECIHTFVGIQAEALEFAASHVNTLLANLVLQLLTWFQDHLPRSCTLSHALQYYLDTSFLDAALRKIQTQDLDQAWDAAYEGLVVRVLGALGQAPGPEEASRKVRSLLMTGGGATDQEELDKQLQALCKDVLKDTLQKMDANVTCLGADR
eukprot:evm.model.scf_93.1 EVM.evm.TU.scf_93.1   scf_93:10277-22533(+)